MARPVTLQQLTDWVKKNTCKTWFTGHEDLGNECFMEGGFAGKPGHTPLIKYIEPAFDCRDMKVFRIKFRGAMPETVVDFRDEFDGTILDLFESKFPNDFKKE
jgi:hypothetical protein